MDAHQGYYLPSSSSEIPPVPPLHARVEQTRRESDLLPGDPCPTCNKPVSKSSPVIHSSNPGLPRCASCSYDCKVCQQAVLDNNRIMAGTDCYYHPDCFKCRTCKNVIVEPAFAMTSVGVYCMKCHSGRMEKIRRRNELKLAQGGPVAGL